MFLMYTFAFIDRNTGERKMRMMEWPEGFFSVIASHKMFADNTAWVNENSWETEFQIRKKKKKKGFILVESACLRPLAEQGSQNTLYTKEFQWKLNIFLTCLFEGDLTSCGSWTLKEPKKGGDQVCWMPLFLQRTLHWRKKIVIFSHICQLPCPRKDTALWKH